jgi:hypothetical protein
LFLNRYDIWEDQPDGSRKRRPTQAVASIKTAQEILRVCESCPAFPATRLALRFTFLTACRQGMIAQVPHEMSGEYGLAWSEIEWDHAGGPVWHAPAEKMKTGLPLDIPLCAHGVRSVFSTVMNECHPVLEKVIDFAMPIKAQALITARSIWSRARHRSSQYLNNRAENSHRPTWRCDHGSKSCPAIKRVHQSNNLTMPVKHFR